MLVMGRGKVDCGLVLRRASDGDDAGRLVRGLGGPRVMCWKDDFETSRISRDGTSTISNFPLISMHKFWSLSNSDFNGPTTKPIRDI